jgi:hypothetical protein
MLGIKLLVKREVKNEHRVETFAGGPLARYGRSRSPFELIFAYIFVKKKEFCLLQSLSLSSFSRSKL